MKTNVPDPSLQITSYTVVSENNLHCLEFWSCLVAEMRKLEVVSVGDVKAAALIQRNEKQGSSVAEIKCEYFKKDGGYRQGSLCPHKHVKLLPKQGKYYNYGALGHRANECARPKPQQKGKTEKRESQKPKVAQMLEVADESERENVSKIVTATVREILGDLEPRVSVTDDH